MASTVLISVAIYENPGILHWSLFIETANASEKTIIHVLGARQKYFPAISTPRDARNSRSLIEILPLCRVDASEVEKLKNIAYDTPIRNELADWSCQDYVLAVLRRLEIASIIDGTENDYLRNKQAVAAKRESWV
ncbi:hypothetical protein FE257_003908 [Aspergillus nanangensis]|uniref:Uncharacterized protein n=1 Tax=Aspergillus nanangensis TaxID=2582783 RepID=A0AAD4CS39_ASPNN|nr:hypothetical protein FE257_003908 [Aspergillus nanangensis]